MLAKKKAFYPEERLDFVSSYELEKIMDGEKKKTFNPPTSQKNIELEGKWVFQKSGEPVLRITSESLLPYKECHYAFLKADSDLIINPYTHGVWASRPARFFKDRNVQLDDFEKIVSRHGYHPGIIRTPACNEIIQIPQSFIVEINQPRFITNSNESIWISGHNMIAVVRDNLFCKKEKNWIHAIYISEGTPFEPQLLRWLETHL